MKRHQIPEYKNFLIDLESAAMTDQERLDDKLRKFFSKQKV